MDGARIAGGIGHASADTFGRISNVSKKRPRQRLPKHFDDVVANAMSFLDRAVEELTKGTRPDRLRFVAMFFYQAVELFVKARLMHEHWSLVLENPKVADRVQFEAGDFRSVGLKEATLRLQKVAGEDVSEAYQAFEPIQKRRNRVVHFHAADLPELSTQQVSGSGRASADSFENIPLELEIIVREQCVAWFELHTLLTQRWRRYFSKSHSHQIAWLDKRMREIRPYLRARFDKLKPKIDRAETNGARITVCGACGYRANEDSERFPGMMVAQCLVCGRTEPSYHFPCMEDGCDGEVVVRVDCKGGTCSVCDEQTSVEDIVSHFTPFSRPDEHMENRDTAFCTECEGSGLGIQTVVRVENTDRCICFACLQTFDSISQCEWCSENIAGSTKDSFWLGCLMCEGRAGHDRDGD